MPWCDPCAEFVAPAAVESGRCPTCGDSVETEDHHADDAADAETVGQNAPWHFWIVVVALAAYLLWRFVVFVIWLFGQIF